MIVQLGDLWAAKARSAGSCVSERYCGIIIDTGCAAEPSLVDSGRKLGLGMIVLSLA